MFGTALRLVDQTFSKSGKYTTEDPLLQVDNDKHLVGVLVDVF